MTPKLCGQKRCYFSRASAIVAVSSRLRKNRSVDYNCFRPYYCTKCGMWHLTKERR